MQGLFDIIKYHNNVNEKTVCYIIIAFLICFKKHFNIDCEEKHRNEGEEEIFQ